MSLIDDFQITSGDFGGFLVGYSFSLGSVTGGAITLEGGQSVEVSTLTWSTSNIITFSVIDLGDVTENTDSSAFKELIILQDGVEIRTLERSEASYSVSTGIYSWTWANETTNCFGTTGTVSSIELSDGVALTTDEPSYTVCSLEVNNSQQSIQFQSSTICPLGRDWGTKRYTADGNILGNYIHSD